MRQRTDRELDQEPLVPEDLVLEEDLVDDLLRAADDVRAAQIASGLEVLARKRRPAALSPDSVHHLRERRERLVRRLLGGLRDEAVRVDAERQRLVTCLDRSPPVELGERREALGHPA